MTLQQPAFWILFLLFGLVNVAYLHRVPGLMGDEASEGQNVFELLGREGMATVGERSYIGPLIDYVRVPFIYMFGFTALALRLPIFLASLATFALAASVFRRWFGEEARLFPLLFMTFSLPYLTHQRLAWAITLLPFFFFLTIWLAQKQWNHKWLLAGLAAGLGLHTHIMFAPTLAALLVTGIIGYWIWPSNSTGIRRGRLKGLLNCWPAIVAFWAAFATQFVVLQMFTDDQGDPAAVGEAWTERLAALPEFLPLILSGSAYTAHYTGVEFTPWVGASIMWLVIILAGLGVLLSWRNKIVWLWLVGLAVHLLVLLYMIDRFSLRYFLMFVLGMYILAGVGAGEIFIRTARLIKRPWLAPPKAVGIAVWLSFVWVWLVLEPFLETGGSVADFSLGNRVDSASALVDERPLLECLRGAGRVSSENIHIYNRLLYLSHNYDDLAIVPEDEALKAQFMVHYRRAGSAVIITEKELCPALKHFAVEKKN